MNKHLLHLQNIARKPGRKIVGLMSGTSLDGLDIALCECGAEKIQVRKFKTVEYSPNLRSRLSAIRSQQQVELLEVCRLNTEMAHLYAKWVLEVLLEWRVDKSDVDLIASHGQTIYHSSAKSQTSTLQIVDGDHIAHKTGIITLSDFRQKHTAAGGQGAPLAAYLDEHIFRHETIHRVMLNLGGIANLTWLPSKQKNVPCLSTDTGPANTLINEAMEKYFKKPFDEGGVVAQSGKVHSGLVKYLLLEPFFTAEFPKTTGQEELNLNLVEALMIGYGIALEPVDLVASLAELTVKSIVRALDVIAGSEAFELYVSGGGVYNSALMEGLKTGIEPSVVKPLHELGMPAEAKEAALMAFLANEMILGHQFSVRGKNIALGKISLPD